MLKALVLHFLFLPILFSQNIAAAQSQDLSSPHYFYVIGKSDGNFAKALRAIPLIGPVFGKKLSGQGLFIKNDEDTPHVFFMGIRKIAKKNNNGFEFEADQYRYKIDQQQSKLIRFSKLSEQNTSEKIDLTLISKGADLSTFLHSSELVNYVPQAEANKLQNALTILDSEYQKLKKEINTHKSQEGKVDQASALISQNASLRKEIKALRLKLLEFSKSKGNEKNPESKNRSGDVKKLKMEVSTLKSELENAKNTIQALLNSD